MIFRAARIGLLGAFAVAAVICMAVSRPAAAADEAAFYKGKTVKIIVGYGPGGGYDVYARMIEPYLSKALGTTVVVENQPGAGGLSALNKLYTAAPDGLQMMLVNGTAAGLSQIIDQPNVKYDLAKLGYLATVGGTPRMWLMSPGNTTVHTVADAMKPGVKIRWSATGITDGLGDGAAVICAALKLDCQIILGYKGSHEASMAVANGEMDAIVVSDTSANSFVKAGHGRPVAALGRKRSTLFPDVPTVFEAVKLTPDQVWWFEFRATLDELGRILVVPPKVPAGRLAYLQGVVKKVLSNPSLIAAGEKSQNAIEYVSPEKTRKSALDAVSSITPAQKQRVKDVILHH